MSSTPLFPLGQTVATRAALATLLKAGFDPSILLYRHQTGDYGDLGKDDLKANADAITHGERILSRYTVGEEDYYVITEWDRSLTTVMLVGEY